MNSDLKQNKRDMSLIEESSSDSSIEQAYRSALKKPSPPSKMKLGTRFSKILLPGPRTGHGGLTDKVLGEIFDEKTKAYTPVSYIN